MFKKGLLGLFERVFGTAEEAPKQVDSAWNQDHAALSNVQPNNVNATSELSPAQVASYLDQGMDTNEKQVFRAQLAQDPAAFQDVVSTASFLEQVAKTTEQLPDDLLKSVAQVAPVRPVSNDNHLGPFLIPMARLAAAFAVAAVVALVAIYA